jgi:hypothetical protein
MDRTKAQIFPCTMRGAFCDIFNCRTQAKWFIGRPDGPLVPDRAMKLCDKHIHEVIKSIPDELLPFEPEKSEIEAAKEELAKEEPVIDKPKRPKPLKRRR